MPDFGEFPDIILGEQDVFSFDYASRGLVPGVDTIENPTVIVSLLDGSDPAPQNIVVDGPTISGLIVSFLMDTQAKAKYCLTAFADAQPGGRRIAMPGTVRVVSPCDSVSP